MRLLVWLHPAWLSFLREKEVWAQRNSRGAQRDTTWGHGEDRCLHTRERGPRRNQPHDAPALDPELQGWDSEWLLCEPQLVAFAAAARAADMLGRTRAGEVANTALPFPHARQGPPLHSLCPLSSSSATGQVTADDLFLTQ